MTDALLNTLYTNPRIGLSGNVNRLFQQARNYDSDILKSQVQSYLWKKPSYQLLKPRKYKFAKEKLRVSGIDSIHTADLADVAGKDKFISRANGGIAYLLILLDTFSKYLWVIPLKSKTGKSLAEAFQQIYQFSKRRPRKLWVDEGTEFYNREVRQVLNNYNIELYSVISPIKAGLAERAVRTIKTQLYRYLMEETTYRYIDVLQDLVDGYNNTKHRTTGYAPSLVRPRHTEEILDKINPRLTQQPFNKASTQRPIYKIGDLVRVQIHDRLFQKAYWGTFSDTLYVVDNVFQNRFPLRYSLKRHDNNLLLEGVFYAQQLIPGTKPDLPTKKKTKR